MADAFHFKSGGDAYIGEIEKSAIDGDVVREAGLRSDGELVQAVTDRADGPDADFSALLDQEEAYNVYAQIAANGTSGKPTQPPPTPPFVPVPYPNIGLSEEDAGTDWFALF